jgi:hypothetical protein
MARDQTGSPTPAETGPCPPGNSEAFGCDLRGGGVVSVCTTVSGRRTLTVRIERPGAFFEHGANGDELARTFTLYSYTRALVSYQGLAFTRQGRSWFVFAESNEEEQGGQSAGARVSGGGEPETFACSAAPRGSMLALDSWLEARPEYPK